MPPGGRRGRERGEFDDNAARKRFYRGLGLKDLVRLLRQEDYLALREFARRYRPLLRAYCDNAGLAVADFVALAGDVLDDVALHLIESSAPTPDNIDNLIITVFKNRFIDEERQTSRRIVRERHGMDRGDDMQAVHLSACSEASLRDAAGPSWDPVALPVGVQRLASMLEEGLSKEERDILSWVSGRMLQSEIAEWLGVSHAAARKRLERLRARVNDIAESYRQSLSGGERRDVDRLFERFDTLLGGRKPPTPRGARPASNE